MNDLPDNRYIVNELLVDEKSKYDHDLVILDLTTLYMLRPTLRGLDKSLGIDLPSDQYDKFDSLFMETLVTLLLESSSTNMDNKTLVYHLESAINTQMCSTHDMSVMTTDIQQYLTQFRILLDNLVSKHTVGYTSVGGLHFMNDIYDLDKFYTLSDIVIFLTTGIANMKLTIHLSTRNNLWLALLKG